MRVRSVFAIAVLLAVAAAISGAQNVAPAPPAARIAFVGDVIFEAPWRQPPVPPDQILANVKERFSHADLAICNLEEPLTAHEQVTRHKNAESVAAGRDFILRGTSPEAARALREAGIGAAALANNHTMDYTERGLLDTLAQLEAQQIVPVGGGKNLEAASQVKVIERNGLRIGLIAFSDVVPAYYWAEEDRAGIASSKETEWMSTVIRRARPHVDFLAVIFHWGIQLARQPSPRQRQLAAAAQRSGADLILGAHPHVLQSVGCAGRVPVIYSAGNFAFPSSRAVSQRTAIFEFEITKHQVLALRVVPVEVDEQGIPRIAEEPQRREILAELAKLSRPLGVTFSGDQVACGRAAGAPAPAKKKSGTRSRRSN